MSSLPAISDEDGAIATLQAIFPGVEVARLVDCVFLVTLICALSYSFARGGVRPTLRVRPLGVTRERERDPLPLVPDEVGV